MKYECKSCGLECSIEANFEPTVCLKTGIICYGWHKVTAPAPKPLSEAINDIAAQKRSLDGSPCGVAEVSK